MKDLIDQLIKCLLQETEHYRTIAILAEQQTELLMAGKVEVLPNNVRLEEKEVFALGPLIAQRNQLLKDIAIANGLKSITLTEAIQKTPIEIVEEFKKTVIDLVRAAKKLEDINRGNEKLLNNALSYVEFTLRLIADGGKRKSFFPSVTAAEEKKSSFVNRIV
jgi:hypothetical protein